MTNEEIRRQLSDSEVMFLTIVGEARGEPVEGQIAVAMVIINRAKNRQQTIKDVCLAPKQFSCWNVMDANRRKLEALATEMMRGSYDFPQYKQIQWVVEGAIGKKLKDNTSGRDHYMTTSLFNSDKRPSWAKTPKTDPIEIGNHTFLQV